MTGMDNLNDKIWITAKTRMISEKRSLRYNFALNFSVSYYSVFLIVFSIFSEFYKLHFYYYDQFGISASVVILAASLISGGFHFESRAASYRSCYLELQKLYDDPVGEGEKRKRYGEILDKYENHSMSDYYGFVIRSIIFEGKEIESGGKPILATKWIFFVYFSRLSMLFVLVLILLIVPFAVLLYPFVK